MPTEAKVATVAQLTKELAEGGPAIVADYRGLTVAELTAMRRSLREQGVRYQVVKNRLARIAARDAGRDSLTALLDGPTGLATGGADEVALAKAFLDATRTYRTVVVRGGVDRQSHVRRRDRNAAGDTAAARGPAGTAGGQFRLAAVRSWIGLVGAVAQPRLCPCPARCQKGGRAGPKSNRLKGDT